MNKKWLKPLSMTLSVSLLLSALGVSAYAVNSDKKNETKTQNTQTAATSSTASVSDMDISKNEAVYALTKADGSVDKIIVSDWIKNALSGDSYTEEDIKKELPIDLTMSYKLDNKAITPEALAGKSGKVSIRIDYKNNLYKTVKVGDKEEKIHVPFVILTGMLLDNETFSNIEVSNGKLVNDGDHTAVMGMAFPGLEADLKIDTDKLKIPDYVEVTADVKDFEMTNTMSLATNEIFSRIDTKELDSAEDLRDSLNQLADAMSQLLDGSSKLYEGLSTLLDKSNELVQGVDKLDAGAAQLKAGTSTLKGGTTKLALGTQTLSDGLGALTQNNDAIKGGAKQVFNSLLDTANTQLSESGLSVPTLTIDNYAEILDSVISSLDLNTVSEEANSKALEAVTNSVNANKGMIENSVKSAVLGSITEQVNTAVNTKVETAVLESLGMTIDEYNAGISNGTITMEMQTQIQTAISDQLKSDAVKTSIDTSINEAMTSEDTLALIEAKTTEQIQALIEQNMASPEVQGQIEAALEKAKTGSAKLSELKGQLDSYNSFYSGLATYTAGVESANTGAIEINLGEQNLNLGVADLTIGMDELYTGVNTLKSNTPALISGIAALKDGAMQLSSGLEEFNEKGVKKLVDAADGDVLGLIDRIKATVQVSKDYKSFSDADNSVDSQVNFIYRTDAIDSKNK